MPKFIISETVHQYPNKTVRLGNTGAANLYGDAETGKFIKLAGESRYVLAAAGDAIEGFITSLNAGTQDGYSIGGFQDQGYKAVTFDGLQATPGTGVIAIGDYVVTGTVTVKDTALPGPAKVCKATTQADAKAGPVSGRVVSLGSVGTGAVGTVGIVEFK